MTTLTTSRGPAIYPDGLPVYSNQDAAYQFTITNFDLTGATAKLQFRDANTAALALELSTANSKIVITPTGTTGGTITLLVSGADSLLLNPNVKWDLFVTDATNKRKAFVKGEVCYGKSITTF